MDYKHIIIPGYDNSGPKHWQTYWEKSLPNTVRVNQKDWLNPICSDWVNSLNETIKNIDGEKILIAHSLGCNTAVEWAKNNKNSIKGALLVAPADLEASEEPELIKLAKTFLPVTYKALPFPAIVISSNSDPYTNTKNSEILADRWGCRFINIGDAGHINDEAGYGPWEEGKKYLQELVR